MPNPPPVRKPKGRTLPAVMKQLIEMNGYRRFSLKERLQILIGYNLQIQCLAEAQHSPGKIEERILCKVTPDIPDPKTFRIVDPKPPKPETR